MMLRLIGGWLRETPQKSYTAGIAISIEAAMLLTAAGIQHGLKSDPTFARLNFTLWTTVLLLIVTIVGFLYISIEQYFSVLERTQQFGNLKVLGAGSGYFCLLLFTETLLMRVTAKLNSKPRPRRTALGADADLEQHQLQGLIALRTLPCEFPARKFWRDTARWQERNFPGRILLRPQSPQGSA